MALEQSQQQFEAASRIGHQSRPLNLFYGLAQAGRALAAASPYLGITGAASDRQAWLPAGGHGLKFVSTIDQNLGLLRTPVQVRPGSADAFSRLSVTVGSPVDVGAVELGMLLSQIHEVQMRYRSALPGPFPLPVPSRHSSEPVNPLETYRVEFHADGFIPDPEHPAESLRAFLDAYPALRDVYLEMESGKPVETHNPGNVWLNVRGEQLRQPNSHSSFELVGADLYRNHRRLVPAAGASENALHPLAAWWMVLFALSMVARYSPSDWMDALDIQSSTIAAMLEFTMDIALDAIPELVRETLNTLSKDAE